MKYLVTGGAGFIGGALIDELVECGNSVACIDINPPRNNKARSYLTDVCDELEVDIVIKQEKPDIIFHMAAESRIQPTIEDPALACRTNFLGTCNILQSARENKVKRVIYSSTSAAYGLKNKTPLTEDMQRDCTNPYSVTKVAAEDLCKMYYTLWGLETVILRYFNVYGEGQPVKGRYAPVIGVFQKQKSEGNKMTIVGDGLQSRDFIHVSDVVKANINSSLVIDSEVFAEIINVGTGKSYSMLDLVGFIGGDYEHVPERLGEARHTQADITKLKKLLNYEPQVKLKDWLKQKI